MVQSYPSRRRRRRQANTTGEISFYRLDADVPSRKMQLRIRLWQSAADELIDESNLGGTKAAEANTSLCFNPDAKTAKL